MENIEHQPGVGGRPESKRKRRDEVSLESALSAQMKLIQMMAPEELRAHLSTDENDPLVNAVGMHWMNKYAVGDFNGFAQYCNEVADDGFMERASQQSLTEEDYDALISYLTTPPTGTPFFTNDELNAFLEDHGIGLTPTLH